MSETITASPEYEPQKYREVEKKYLPLFPERFDTLRAQALPIEQRYLSHPDEPFSVRLRESINENGTMQYSATLKDRGEIGSHGLNRLEVETTISKDTYTFYASHYDPLVRKLRAHINNHVVVDYFEDGRVCIEAEDPIAWTSFLDQKQMNQSHFDDVSGDRIADNEWWAHRAYRAKHEGRQAIEIEQDTSPSELAQIIEQCYTIHTPHIVQIIGRSGSGKSTYVRELQAKLAESNMASIVLSTDDYHRGTSWLETQNDGNQWQNWDAPIVYDTGSTAKDLRALLSGEEIVGRRIDFETGEPVLGQNIAAQPLIIVEGIYAGAPEISQLSTIRHEMKTPLATSIGRRLLRDATERPEFADLEKSLRYILEIAEVEYRRQASLAHDELKQN